mmetsp:Transcript_36980/g.114189  ORF Transcript_36980/g.114189 Transcript_36980/m.114189 type:complete len:444 (+) Transcript_36980:332-1663(+)
MGAPKTSVSLVPEEAAHAVDDVVKHLPAQRRVLGEERAREARLERQLPVPCHLVHALAPGREAALDGVVAGVLHAQLGAQLVAVAAELREHGLEVAAVEDDLAREALADLDLVLEDDGVVVELHEGRDGHHLRDGAEEDDGALLERRHVVDAVGHVLERVGHHGVEALDGLLLVLLGLEVGELLAVVAPDLLGPEHARRLLDDVLVVVADDVGLLEEEAHAVGDAQVLGDRRVLEPARREEAREAVADEAGDVVAVEVVVGLGHHLVLEEVHHAHRHAVADVGDDLQVRRLQLLALARHAEELLEQRALLALADAVDVPVVEQQLLVERGEDLALGLHGDRHVVLDGVEPAQHEVEQANGVAQLVVELDDDGREAAGHVGQDVVAELEVHLVVTQVHLDVAVLRLDADHREELVHTEEIAERHGCGCLRLSTRASLRWMKGVR